MGISVKEWRERNRKAAVEGVELQLPSGLVVRVRNLSIMDFILHADIPENLTAIVADMLDGKMPDMQKTPAKKFAGAIQSMYNAIALSVIVYPRVVESDPQGEDEIGVDEIDMEDKAVLRSILEVPVRKLESFCREQTEDSIRLSNLEAVPPATEQGAKSQRMEPALNGTARKR